MDFGRDPFAGRFRSGRGASPLFFRFRLRRESLPMTALRLTPISPAIWRQDNPASKCLFRSSRRSSVQVGWLAGMSMVPARSLRILLAWFASEPPLPRKLPLWRPAIVADGQQPFLDGVPNTFLDQGLCDAGNTGAVGALSHQLLKVGDGRERQRNRNAVGFGFFCGHAEKLAFNRCTEKYLFRVY